MTETSLPDGLGGSNGPAGPTGVKNVEQPTPTDGASITDRILATMQPETVSNDSQMDELPEDSQDTQILEEESIGEDLEVEAEADNSEEFEAESEANGGDDGESAEYELSDIAQLTGIDEKFLSVGDEGDLLVRTKIDGIEGTAKLNDLLESYQLKGHLNNQNQKAVELQKELEAERAQLQQQAQGKFQEAEDLLRVAYSQLVDKYNKVDWDELRQDDPAEFAAMQREFENRNTEIQTAYQQVQNERQQAQSQQLEQIKEVQARENAILVDGKTIPGWDNPEVAEKEFSQVMEYGQKIGYPVDVLQNIMRHQDIQVLYESMKYREMKSKLPEVQKKVRKAPKIAKPGRAATKQEARNRELMEARKRVISGQSGAVADYFMKAGKV